VTDLEGFNRGYLRYFLVRKETNRSCKGASDWKQTRAEISRTLSYWQRSLRSNQALAGNRSPEKRMIKKVNERSKAGRKHGGAKRRLDVKRETRFLRLQAYLQSIWNSASTQSCFSSLSPFSSSQCSSSRTTTRPGSATTLSLGGHRPGIHHHFQNW
jgi:hypothetical protein